MTLGVVRRARSGERWRTVSSEHGCHSPNVPHRKESCPMHIAALCPKAYADEIITARKGMLSR